MYARFGALSLVVLAGLAAVGCSGSDSGRSLELRLDAVNDSDAIEAGVSYLDDPYPSPYWFPSPFWIGVMVDAESPLAEFSEQLGLDAQAARWERFRSQVTAECDQEVGSWIQAYDEMLYMRGLYGNWSPSLHERKTYGFGVVLKRLGEPLAVGNATLAVATRTDTCIERVRDAAYASEARAFAALGDTYPEFYAVDDVALGPLQVPNVSRDRDWESCMRDATGLDGYLAVSEAVYQNEDLTLEQEREIAIEDWFCRLPALESWIEMADEHQRDYIDAHRDDLTEILTSDG